MIPDSAYAAIADVLVRAAERIGDEHEHDEPAGERIGEATP